MIDRVLEKRLLEKWNDDKVIIVLGPRQVGKTTLLKKLCQDSGDFLFLNGDDPSMISLLSNAGENQLRQIIGNYKLLFIDEAQRIPNIGIKAKIIHDQIKEVKLVLSGSSALELADRLNESLTGRKWEYLMYPISWAEFSDHIGFLKAKLNIHTRLIYGMYPEVLTAVRNENQILTQLAGSYLYKDILQYGGIRKPEILQKLLIALALQIGSEVNYNELANTLRVDRNTVESYIHLLEKVFVIFKLNPLSRNARNELSTGRKIYFYDNGIRNAIIGDFKPVEIRTDTGQLWENFIISERLKMNCYSNKMVFSYYWRTYQQREIDLIEECNGVFSAFECKWNANRKSTFPKGFSDNYKPKEMKVINQENFTDYLLNLPIE
ncbi:MAG: ATP-binding protein [Crocinitomicaceae bacterium]|nr:ATP-binding protein [Crocinitomicaceae bacterium]